MSFGFSVGDFITAIQLASKIRKEFVDAPSQFNVVSDEYVVYGGVRSSLTITFKIGSERSQSSFKMPT